MPRRTRKPAAARKRAGAQGAAPQGWLPVLRDAGRTKYLALVAAIRAAIDSGELARGERLPSQRVLAEHLGVNIATVTKAIAEAGRLGLVSTRHGGGTQVAGERPAAVAAGAEDGAVIDLSINIPPALLVKPVLDDVIAELARRRAGDELFDYRPVGGAYRDRATGCAWIATRGVEASPDRLLLTQGAHEGLFAALATVTEPGDVVLCEDMNYTGIRRLGELCRIRLVGVATDAGGLRPDALEQACRKHAPKALVCTPVTLNPTTATLDLPRRQAIAAAGKRHAITIIEDDIYGHLAGDGTPPLAAIWPDGVIYACSLSKCVAPGLRVGYLSAPERLMSGLRDALLLTSWTAPSLQAGVANELIESGRAQACASTHRDEALRRMALARELLGPALVASAVASYHAWLRLPPPWLERDATAAFRRHGVRVSPAHHFVFGAQETPAAVRLSLGAVADAGTLERALRIVAGVLDSSPRGQGSVV